MTEQVKDLAPLAEVNSPESPPASAGGDQALTRDKGRFVAGQSGNPAGRAKGSKNRIVEARQTLEYELREYIGDPSRKKKLFGAIDKVLDIAISGEDKVAVQAFKVLADKTLGSVKAEETLEDAQRPVIHIEIVNHTEGAEPPRVIIDHAEDTDDA